MTAIYDFSATAIDGTPVPLDRYRGKVLLIVNTASKCGFTPQYDGLETLHEQLSDKGLVILGFPCNQFGGQEPGGEAEIESFCRLTYDVKFPIFSKISVKGDDQHPLYKLLTGMDLPATGEGPMREKLVDRGLAEAGDKGVLWNFEKFLVGRDGKVVARFAPDVTADDQRLVQAIDKELAAG